ncbi:FepA family TonB-dependent siderophore receptor [Paracoccus benzoatiresistens]|uniref:FepA family TonB-dependent siderophore receptor n=1 Tax=Paracoccus benzoatiresistens TaxID=2997341 RepID=A0ABT4J594_9RHOB|nr:FepA family TonB-dependent siderophore receptor [Paracoccus sp. EF6]MCZ0962264.1 FepA family TonB-dependent siderophore receptor [Paracoccus sp. EF6]
MAAFRSRLVSGTSLSLLMSAGLAVAPLRAQEVTVLEEIVLTAEEQTKQALGVSQITEEDLEKQPVVNDIAEAVRKQPGVNLTGSTATGQRGNQRQIDIRGIGPENTLILIDGKPVLSRNSVKMSRGGERDTRGDSNWVPAELIERIEVIRGPAAARYGSGASGGVVNIITKRPETFTGQLGLHWSQPQNSQEGVTKRTNFMLAGPAGERLTVRVFGNYNKTGADDPDLNPPVTDPETGEVTEPYAAREGVVNKDAGALLTWDVAPGHELDLQFDFSRQGNIFAGDTRNGAINDDSARLAGSETSRMYRRTLSTAHRGQYDFGESMSYLQWEQTDNTRLCTGLAGRFEDNYVPCVDTDGDGENDAFRFNTIKLDNIAAKSEWIMPMDLGGRASRMTLGAEYRGEFMHDPHSIANDLPPELVPDAGVPEDPADRDPDSEQNLIGLYAESNIEWDERLTLTPALRFDYSDTFGNVWSPGLNATYEFNDEWTMKLGVARAFKTPNLFQLNPNYVYRTNGNGCPWVDGEQLSGPCLVLGNPDLEAEKSLNSEIGIAYEGLQGINASLTYFHNDYDNRIGSGFVQYNQGATENRLYRWENEGKAVVSGLEGNFSTDLGDRFAFNANFTKMIRSEKDNGEPLSLVPEYTINAALDWHATEALTVTLSATHYGRIEAASVASTTGEVYEDTESRDPYTLVNLGGNWRINDTARVSAGISNLFDKTVVRTGSGSDANTFNEPGRAFYLSLDRSF